MEIRSVSVGRSIGWIGDGFGMFRQGAGKWILLIVVYALISIVIGIIPFLGAIAASVLGPVFVAGLMHACRQASQGTEVEVGMLFEGFHRKTGDLVSLGLLNLLIVILIGGVVWAMAGGSMLGVAAFDGNGGPVPAPPGLSLVGMVGLLIAALIGLAYGMAMAFAPALVYFDDLKPVNALLKSFFGCLYNFLPFLVWGVAAMLLVFVGSIPFGLGLLVVAPTLVCSIYLAYTEIFAA